MYHSFVWCILIILIVAVTFHNPVYGWILSPFQLSFSPKFYLNFPFRIICLQSLIRIRILRKVWNWNSIQTKHNPDCLILALVHLKNFPNSWQIFVKFPLPRAKSLFPKRWGNPWVSFSELYYLLQIYTCINIFIVSREFLVRVKSIVLT